MRQIGDILSEGRASIEALLREAFAAGRAEAAAEMRAKMADMINSVTDIPMTGGASSSYINARFNPNIGFSPPVTVERRASPGTVKPEILRLIREASAGGISTDELIAATGFKPNSVRGTVSTLRIEHAIERVGDRWVAVNWVPTTSSEDAPGGPDFN
jgi:hypothetical protein